jgi:hypothetical protein
MTSDALREQVAAVFGEIVAAARLVRSGRVIELDDLDKRIDLLCEAVTALPREDGRAMLPLFDDLRASLDELSDVLKTAFVTDSRPAAP